MTIPYQEPKKPSTNIKAMAYQDGKGYVEFHGGRRFAYHMPRDLFNQMQAAPSVGSFFARNVKSTCPVAWDGYACNHQGCREDASHRGTVAGQDFHICGEHAKDRKYEHAGLRPLSLAERP